ncbi:MAG: adenosylmethionine--8-amino-7-oxononanoate transaminase [Pseudomonadota bacterium]
MKIKPSPPASRKSPAPTFGSEAEGLLRRSLAAVWHPCTQMKHHEWLPLVPVARGKGVWLYDFDGRRYLDAISSWWVNLFGHSHPKINAAIAEQLERLEHVILAGFTHAPAVELAERLSALAPGRLGHCFFASDGSSAVEIALKMSFHYWKNTGLPAKNGFVTLAGSYHGETLGALSVGDVALYKETYQPLLRPCGIVPSPDGRLAEPEESAEAYALRAADALERHLERHHREIAALIVEPLVQCAGGMAMYHPAYLARARALCDRYQVHLIADEIAVGFGRTGTLFACEQANVAPDFLCLSKGLTGGYLPLSIVLTREEIYQAFYADEVRTGFLHSHSYSGNPLACRAALATLDLFEQENVLAANRDKARFMNEAAAPLEAHPRVRNFRNTGMIWAFEVEGAGPHFPREVFREALGRELLLRPLGATVYYMPPYVIEPEEMAFLVEGTLKTLDAVCG